MENNENIVVSNRVATTMAEYTQDLNKSFQMNDWKTPIVVHGLCGCGKTGSTIDVAGLNGKHVCLLQASKIDLTELQRIPYPNQEKGIVYEDPWFVNELREHNGGVLVIDELGTGKPSVMNMLLSLIQERQCDGYKIPDNTFIVCLTNDTDVANNISISGAINDRVCHLYIQCDILKDLKPWLLDYRAEDNQKIDNAKEKINPLHFAHKTILAEIIQNEPKFQKRAYNAGYLNGELGDPSEYISIRTLTNCVEVLDMYDRDGEEKEANSGIIERRIGGFAGADFAHQVILKLAEQSLFSFHPDKWDGKVDSIREGLTDSFQRTFMLDSMWWWFKSNPSTKELDKLIKLINYGTNFNSKYGDYEGSNTCGFTYVPRMVTFSLTHMKKGGFKLGDVLNKIDLYHEGSDDDKTSLSCGKNHSLN